MVPPAAPPTPPSSTAPAGPRWWIAAVVAGLLVSFVVGSAFLPVPYVAMRPGTARPVTQYVTVRGATSYPPAESIAYMTVNIWHISPLDAAVGLLNDAVDTPLQEVIQGGRSVEANRRYKHHRVADHKTTHPTPD